MKQLLEQIEHWHEDESYGQIIEAIEALPEHERDYELIGQLARALNNSQSYEEALLQLQLIAAEGEQDERWHFRAGYAYFHLAQYEQAAKAFEQADQLQPEDETTEWFLSTSRRRATKQLRDQERMEKAKQETLTQGKAREAAEPFAGFDLTDFWEDSAYALETYVSEPPTNELITSLEEELGYKLPESYISLMRQQNGGIPVNTCCPTEERTSWSEDHVAISGIMGIGRDKPYSIGGEFGSRFMIEDWGYPDIGVVICDCPSAGHDVIMLDYRHSGKTGEPAVVHVDQEDEYEITFLAPDFETFIRGLVHEDVYDTSEEDKAEDLRKVREGEFSQLLQELCAAVTEIDSIEKIIRSVCMKIVEEKGHFSFHADKLSLLMYDVQFWLYTKVYPQTGREQYLKDYSSIMVFCGAEFSLGGYAPGFIEDWIDASIEQGKIKNEQQIVSMTDAAVDELLAALREFQSLC